jgi:chitinase
MTAPQIIAYYPEWGGYTARDLLLTGSAPRLTVINYAFGVPAPAPEGREVVCSIEDPAAAYGRVYTAAESLDGVPDAPNQPLSGHFNQLRKLKARFPNLKVVVSLGGWTGSTWFSDAARTPQSRERFVASCIDLYVDGNLPALDGAGGEGAGLGVFDGLDVDWEFPVSGGLETTHRHPDDVANFVLLLEEFRRQFAARGRPDLLLTAAIPAPPSIAADYNLAEAHALLDWINLMTYDLAGAWNTRTGHHTNLCTPPDAPGTVSVDSTVRLFRETYGVPAAKLVVGSAFYGRAWTGVPAANDGLHQPGRGVEGMAYHELAGLTGKGYTRHWDDGAQAPWLYNPTEEIFWTYDDPQSLELKARYVRRHGLAGMMFWEITGDDQQGSLVEAIHNELHAEGDVGDPCGP